MFSNLRHQIRPTSRLLCGAAAEGNCPGRGGGRLIKPDGWRGEEGTIQGGKRKNFLEARLYLRYVHLRPHCRYQGAFQEINIPMNRALLTSCKI